MVAAHTADAEAVLARAQTSAARPEQVVAELEPLLVRLRGVRKGDRLAPAKHTALALLARAQRDRGETAAVLATAAAWQEFDALDLDAKLMAQAALAALPGRGQEAAAGARALFELAPGSERFLLPHLRACLAARDEAAVAHAFFAHLAAG